MSRTTPREIESGPLIGKTGRQEWWQGDQWKKWAEAFLSPDNDYNPETDEEVNFLERNILGGKTERVLDVCCGFGRHTIEIAKRGYSVSGLDYSSDLLKMGLAYSREAGIPVELILGDMRKLPFRGRVDVILNMFQSFGYFSDAENKEVLRGFADALKKNGRLFLDLRNPGYIFSRIRSGKHEVLPHDSAVNGTRVVTTERIDEASGRWMVRWDWPEDGKSWDIGIRLYNLEEMKQMLEHAGFSIDKAWGSWDGEAFNAERSQRLMILAKKDNHAS